MPGSGKPRVVGGCQDRPTETMLLFRPGHAAADGGFVTFKATSRSRRRSCRTDGGGDRHPVYQRPVPGD